MMADASPKKSETILRDRELKNAVVDRWMAPVVPPPGNDLQQAEFFCRLGDWVGTGGRAERGGTYTIKGDRLCVSSAGKLECRTVAKNEAGQYFTQIIVETKAGEGYRQEVDLKTLGTSPC